MHLRELLDRLPVRRDHHLSVLLIASGAIGLTSCAVCCGGCLYVFSDKPAPVAKQSTFQVDALPSDVVAAIDRVIAPRTPGGMVQRSDLDFLEGALFGEVRVPLLCSGRGRTACALTAFVGDPGDRHTQPLTKVERRRIERLMRRRRPEIKLIACRTAAKATVGVLAEIGRKRTTRQRIMQGPRT